MSGADPRALARATFRRLLDGGAPDSTTPEACGEWAPLVVELYTTWKAAGTDGVKQAVAGWASDDPALAVLLGEGDVPARKLLSAHDILTRAWPEPPWAVPQLLPVGLGVLGGRPKLGKSWLALQEACAVATGGMLFGNRVARGRVLYLALEDPPRRLKTRMLAQHWPANADADFLCLGDFSTSIGDLAKGGAERLANLIADGRYRLVVIDTFSRAVHTDQNDSTAVTAALTPIQEMAHECACAVQLVDHHKKPGLTSSLDLVADIMGSTAKGAMADVIWGLYRERGKAEAVLSVTGRDVEEVRLALRFDGLTGCWQCEGDADKLKLTEARQELIDAIRSLGDRATNSAIAKATGRDRGNTYRQLQDLVTAGMARKRPAGGDVVYELP